LDRIKLELKTFYLTFFFLICFGCQSQDVPLTVEGSPYQEVEKGGIGVALRFMDEPELVVKHGERTKNPFISERYLLFSRPILVFEVTLQNQTEESLELRVETIILDFGHRLLKPISLFNLETHWQMRDELEKTHKEASQIKQKLIRDYVFPAVVSVEPSGRKSGYVVFMMSDLPTHGEATLAISLLALPSKDIHDFTFYYAL
jgi:hypothetical protein